MDFQICISAMVHMKGQQWHLSKKKFWMALNRPYFHVNQDFFKKITSNIKILISLIVIVVFSTEIVL